jgi:hypothetical protein
MSEAEKPLFETWPAGSKEKTWRWRDFPLSATVILTAAVIGEVLVIVAVVVDGFYWPCLLATPFNLFSGAIAVRRIRGKYISPYRSGFDNGLISELVLPFFSRFSAVGVALALIFYIAYRFHLDLDHISDLDVGALAALCVAPMGAVGYFGNWIINRVGAHAAERTTIALFSVACCSVVFDQSQSIERRIVIVAVALSFLSLQTLWPNFRMRHLGRILAPWVRRRFPRLADWISTFKPPEYRYFRKIQRSPEVDGYPARRDRDEMFIDAEDPFSLPDPSSVRAGEWVLTLGGHWVFVALVREASPTLAFISSRRLDKDEIAERDFFNDWEPLYERRP